MERHHINIIKFFAWVIGLLLGAILIISAVEKKQENEINKMVITVNPLPDGSNLMDKSKVKQIIDRSFGFDLEDIRIGRLDIARLERVLEEEPLIFNADVYISADEKLHIEISQREPVLRIMDKNGLDYYLDKNGIRMPPPKNFAARVLIATGNIPPYTVDFLKPKKKGLLKDLFILVEKIDGDDFLKSLVEQIHVINGEFILVPNLGRQKILLGDFSDMDDKLNRLKIFYKEALPYDKWQKYRIINLKYRGQVVAK